MPTPFGPRDHTITAELSRLKEARDFAEAAAREFGLDDDGSYQVKLAMSEAVANAIQHGSASASDPIKLHAVEEGGELALYVTDTGRFVPRVSPRGDFPERGRGLEFMSLIMDDVEVRPGPNGTVAPLLEAPKRAARGVTGWPRRRPLSPPIRATRDRLPQGRFDRRRGRVLFAPMVPPPAC